MQSGELPIKFDEKGAAVKMPSAKESRVFDGKQYILEKSIKSDVALIKVHRADRLGNCQFRRAMNNFNEAMGKNAQCTIVEADHIVEVGEIEPESVHLQGIYVDKVTQSRVGKEIEKLTFMKTPEELAKSCKYPGTYYGRAIRK